MTGKHKQRALILFIATVWLVNGLICKVFGLVPRHEQIVAAILGDTYSGPLTKLIGILETGMGIWILTGYKAKLNTIIQIVIVAVMNVLEFVLVPELLLWGRLNAVFALIFIGIVYYSGFVLNRKNNMQII